MITSELAQAQAELRYSYRSASVGQVYAGTVWLFSAVMWMAADHSVGVLVLLVGGFFIYPVTTLASRLLGSPGAVPPANPLREASIAIPVVGALCIPVVGAAALYDINWFYPAFMVVMGAHYLPFSFLYGMRVFVPLGAAMWLAGIAIGLWAPQWSVVGALLTGAALVGVGARAAIDYRNEFSGSTTGERT